jgi:hypothetical protein
MLQARMPFAAIALVAGLAVTEALAASTTLSQYPDAEEQIKSYFRQNFGTESANCGPGQINDISDAEIVTDTPQQLTVNIDYTFSAKSLQNTNTCSGTQSSMVTFDKADGKLVINKMSGATP